MNIRIYYILLNMKLQSEQIREQEVEEAENAKKSGRRRKSEKKCDRKRKSAQMKKTTTATTTTSTCGLRNEAMIVMKLQ